MTLPPLENRLRFKHLALLRALHREKSLHRTAARLHMSQPAATKLLRELESLFGGELFTRSRTGMQPTATGLLLLEHAQAILAQLELAHEEVASGEEAAPIVRVGASAIAVRLELLPVMGGFHAAYPGGMIRILEDRTSPLLKLLRQGEIDLAIGMASAFVLGEDSLRGLSCHLLRQEHWVAVTTLRHPFARKKKVGLDALQTCRWVLQPRASLIRTAFEQAFLARGRLAPRPMVEVLPFDSNLSVVRSFDAVTIAPRSVISTPEKSGDLIALRTDLEVEVPPMAVFYKEGALERGPVRVLLGLMANRSTQAAL